MNRTKQVLLAACVSLALAFTLSCSSDDGGDDNVPSSSSGGGNSSGSGDGGKVEEPVLCNGKPYDPAMSVCIGTQIWMSKNLDVAGGKCYGEDVYVYVYDEDAGDWIEQTLTSAEIQANCTKYGRLYDWATAMKIDASCNEQSIASCGATISSPHHQGICPTGWHIPSNEEWNKLYEFAEEGECDYDGWYCPTAGTKLKSSTGWNDGGVPAGTNDYGFSALPGGYGYSDGGFFSAGNYGYWWSSDEGEDYSYDAYDRYMDYDDESALWSHDYKASLFSVRCLKD